MHSYIAQYFPAGSFYKHVNRQLCSPTIDPKADDSISLILVKGWGRNMQPI